MKLIYLLQFIKNGSRHDERWIGWCNYKGIYLRLQPKMYECLRDNNEVDKQTEGTKKCVIKHEIKFSDYKNCLKLLQIEKELAS